MSLFRLALLPAIAGLTFAITACVEPVTSDQQRKIQAANIDNPIYSEYLWNIAKEFDKNSIVAEDKYLFHPVEVRGLKVSGIDDGSSNDTVDIDLSATLPPGAGWEFFGASTDCEVPRSHPAVSALQEGDEVIVRGVFISESSGLQMGRCKFYVNRHGKWF